MSITEATTGRWSRKIADTILGACNGQGENEYVLERWAYVPGMLLMAMARAGVQLAEPEYLSFMTRHMDSFIREDGSIRSYTLEEYNLDQINGEKPVPAVSANRRDALCRSSTPAGCAAYRASPYLRRRILA